MSLTTKSESVPRWRREDWSNRAGNGERVFERLGFVGENVGTRGGETLIVGHVVTAQIDANFAGDGDRLGGSLTYSSNWLPSRGAE